MQFPDPDIPTVALRPPPKTRDMGQEFINAPSTVITKSPKRFVSRARKRPRQKQNA